ncbi:MAG: phosphorylase family protein [Planctomycetota bacterium]|jgi:uridine phosphorylase
MFLGRHTCLSWILAGPGISSVPLLAEVGGAPPYVIAVGDRRRVARVLARLEDPLDLSAHCRAAIGEAAAGRVDLGIGRVGAAAVMAVETQMGGPPTEIVLREVLDRTLQPEGARAVIRVGSCGTLADGEAAPALVVAEFATGWSATVEQWKRGVLALPAEHDPRRPPQPPKVPCSAPVVAALRAAAAPAAHATAGGIFSKDSLYAEQDARFAGILRDLGCVATEMELATIGPIAASMGVAWGGVMATAGCLDTGAWYAPDLIARNEDLAIATALEAIRILSGQA